MKACQSCDGRQTRVSMTRFDGKGFRTVLPCTDCVPVRLMNPVALLLIKRQRRNLSKR